MKKLVLLSNVLMFFGVVAYTPAPGSGVNPSVTLYPESVVQQMMPSPAGPQTGTKYENKVLTITNNTISPLSAWTSGFHETDAMQIAPGETKALIVSTIDPSVRFDFLLPRTVTVVVHVKSDGREVTKEITKRYDTHQAMFYRDNFSLSVGELSNGNLVIREERPIVTPREGSALLPAWSPGQTGESSEGALIHYPSN